MAGKLRRRRRQRPQLSCASLLSFVIILLAAATSLACLPSMAHALESPTALARKRKPSHALMKTSLLIRSGEQQNVRVGTIAPKQGAYGKLKIHKEPLLSSIFLHLDEVIYGVVVLLGKFQKTNLLSKDYIRQTFAGKEEDLIFCNEILGKVSRSFSTVIRQLPDALMVDILVFYLILRALDTIEDDPLAFAGNPRTKINLLKTFYQRALPPMSSSSISSSSSWSLDGVGEGHEKRLLQEFARVQSIYSALSEESKAIIVDITKRMGAGMAETIGKDLTQGTTDLLQYNKYCHFVAGLVGEGLSRLFAQSKLEESYLADELYLSDQMGLFLQKTNIIRDYLEDYVEGRTFWPQTIWKKYCDNTDNKFQKSKDLGYFTNQTNPEVRANAMKCLNEMITDALELVPSCLSYLSGLQCPEIFRFCAIPQVMAIATLAKCYANLNVFTGVVKIRKGLSCKLMMRATSLDSVHEIFFEQAKWIEHKAFMLQQQGFSDPSMEALLDACDIICAITEPAYQRRKRARLQPMLFVSAVAVCQFLPSLTLVLVAVALLNYYFGPLRVVADPYYHQNHPTLWLARVFKEVAWKK